MTDAAGNGLAGTFDFFVLAGDATADRTVDTADFTALAQNFGKFMAGRCEEWPRESRVLRHHVADAD